MISIICVYNNKKILNKYLIKSLKNQTVDYELIILDNSNGKFKSAAEALNYGAKKVNNDYIMFVHQDMELYEEWLNDAEKILNSLKSFGIVGVAGKSKKHTWAVSNIKDGIPPKEVSNFKIKHPLKVQTLDECLVIIHRSIFQKLQFDEKICDDWHLYVVDYCLTIKKMGYDIYVIPLFAYHRSSGYSLSEEYYKTLEKLLKKHKKDYNLILTTMGNWTTLYSLKNQRRYLWFKRFIIILLKFIN